ncbi:putative polygalacturonase [Quercus suber]|uniref:Polygalacturonase n=1 Tax=Quercus suber TaxID=58331 RepID=A0AAW0KGY5_QUESU
MGLSLKFKTNVLSAIVILGMLSLRVAECSLHNKKLAYQAINCRKHTAILTDFGAVGDGKTLNTKVFNAAIRNLSRYALDGGAQLIVPPGRWLTGSFNLTSHFTLFIEKGAVILGSQDESQWPPLPVLPSYGRGRDAPGGRLSALIFGTNLTDVVITGNNGTIDGQGATWWKKYRAKEYNVTRPYLIELMYSNQIQISDLTLLDSPSWFVHPIYSSNIIVKGLTIIASIYSANTDGVDPGSEMSGGIQDVRAEDITAIDTESAVRVKTAVGRGGYVKDIYVRRMTLKNMKYAFWMAGNYKQHPDPNFDLKAIPEINGINYRDVVATNVTFAGRLDGITGDPFTGICISNVTMTMNLKENELPWNCTDIAGVTSKVTPKPCASLYEKQGVNCAFPTDKLPIEDVQLKTCSSVWK